MKRFLGFVFLTGLIVFRSIPAVQAGPVQVFILAGQSNMEGKAKLELLEYQIQAPETRDRFAHLHKNGDWVEREDVWIKFLDRHGNLKVGYGSPNCIGPELEFGWTMGDALEDQVLLIKTAWGGKSLGRDFRPPGSGLPSEEMLNAELERANANRERRNRPETSMEEIRAAYGHYYREMIREVRTTLSTLEALFPSYEGQGYELAGLVWFQGWNDLFDEDFREHYDARLAQFIRDVRRELQAPNLPVVIGQMGQGGVEDVSENVAKIKEEQAAAAAVPEFRETVRLVPTDIYWDKQAAALVEGWQDHVEAWKKVGSDYGYHYLGSAITFSEIGKAFGRAMLDLRRQ